jgi:hypothetical protein
MLRCMMQKTGSILLVGLFTGCSGSAGSAFGPPRASNTSDAAGLDATSDASEEVVVGPALNCPAACPMAEPAPGDPCDLGADCEYGDSQLIECNRVYFCSLGHFQKWHFDDTSVCGSALPSACPATRAAAAAVASCSTAGLRCPYMEGECDCVQTGGATVWHCFPDNPLLGSQVHCAVTRPRLGTSCTAQSVSCQYTPICEAIACSTCGQWAMVPYPCPLGAMPDAGTVAPDAGTTPDAATPEAGSAFEAGTRHDGGKDAH